MPPRYAYWTIIAGGLPTAFRMTEREELLPTFRRIKQKHPDAEMKYFARGRLWSSPDEARAEAEARRKAAAKRHSTRGGPFRGRDWRPGGGHQDPRQKFKDAKTARNQDRRQERFDRRHKSAAAQATGDRPWNTRGPRRAKPAASGEPPWRDRGPRGHEPGSPGDRPWSHRPPQTGKPPAPGDRPWRDRAPRGDKPGAARDRPWSGRAPRDTKPGAPRKPEERRDRPWRDRPSQDGRRGGLSPDKPKAEDRKPAAPRPKASHGSPKANGFRKPAPRPRPPASGSRPAGAPDRGRKQGGPVKDRRRR